MVIFQDPQYTIDAYQAKQLIDDRDAQVIDVREAHEHDAGHIPDDRHLPMEYVALETESLDPHRPVIFYCRAGTRSGMAASAYRTAGWDAYNLAGGLLAWVDADQRLEPGDGTVADH